MFRNIRRIASAAILAIAPIATLLTPGLAHAASVVTWTGGGVNTNWSTAANWAGGVAPVSGDSVVIDNAAAVHDPVDDIAGLSLVSLSFINNAPSGALNMLSLSQDLTVTSAITQAASDTTSNIMISSLSGTHAIQLGGNVTVTSLAGMTLGAAGDTIGLNSYTLTFTDSNTTTKSIVAIDASITGAGSVVYDGPSTSYSVTGTNTYSGTTHAIRSDTGISSNTNTSGVMFGTSTVTIEGSTSVTFEVAGTLTINNPIVINGTANGNAVNSLIFDTVTTGSFPVNVPNITLNASTRFANLNRASMTINLAGIIANGHCVQYVDGVVVTTDQAGAGFINGPAACVIAVAPATTTTTTPAAVVAPKVPNTGFALTTASPVTILAVTLAGVSLIAGAAYKLRHQTARR